MRAKVKPKPDRLVIRWAAPHLILGQLSLENRQEHPEGVNDTPSSQLENKIAFEETIKWPFPSILFLRPITTSPSYHRGYVKENHKFIQWNRNIQVRWEAINQTARGLEHIIRKWFILCVVHALTARCIQTTHMLSSERSFYIYWQCIETRLTRVGHLV